MLKFLKHIIREYLLSAILAVVIVVVMNQFIIISRISGPSMYPALCSGDIAIFSRISLDDVKEGDIIAFNYNDEYLVKRIIAMDGDIVHIEQDSIYVNKEKVVEAMQGVGLHIDKVDFTIGNHQLFVVGDNSIESYDSRMFGSIDKSVVMGKLLFRFTNPISTMH